jgi:hypothetical protein
MTGRLLVTVTIAAWIAAAMLAASVPALADGPRYVLLRVEGGLIRMDTATGWLSQCSPDSGVWSCRTLSEEGRDLDDEITALKAENEALKARLAAAGDTRSGRLELPSDAELDRLVGVFDKMMRRFMDFARGLEGGKRDDI